MIAGVQFGTDHLQCGKNCLHRVEAVRGTDTSPVRPQNLISAGPGTLLLLRRKDANWNVKRPAWLVELQQTIRNHEDLLRNLEAAAVDRSGKPHNAPLPVP